MRKNSMLIAVAAMVIVIAAVGLMVGGMAIISLNRAGTLGDFYAGKTYEHISMSDIYLPENLDKESLGLFWLTDGEWIKADKAAAYFDPEKPIVIYAHGMGGNAGTPNADAWASNGYNVGCFMWGAFAEDEPYRGQSKVWGVKSGCMRWDNGGSYEENDIPDHCIAEIYAACYNDFMANSGFKGGEIRLMGHSLGSQLTLAVTNYFMAEVKAGKMNPAFLPDRISLMDPFLSNNSDSTYVDWLDSTLEDGGSVKAALITAQSMLEFGIACDMFRSSSYVETAAYAGGLDGYYEAFTGLIAYQAADTGFLPIEYGLIDGVAMCHQFGEDWYTGTLDSIYPDLNAADATNAYGISAGLPYPYIFTRMGTSYALNINHTYDDFADDTARSDNIASARIAGFVFMDANANGRMDDRLFNRMLGVTVSLYTKGNNKPFASVITGLNGYYEFSLPQVSNEYYVKAELPRGYSFSTGAAPDGLEEMQLSNIDNSGISIPLVYATSKDLYIVNVGLIKND